MTKKITVTLSDDVAQNLDTLARRCSEADRVRGATHGALTGAQLLAMLAEDAAMMMTRPGCWEASNMRDLLASHGYEV